MNTYELIWWTLVGDTSDLCGTVEKEKEEEKEMKR